MTTQAKAAATIVMMKPIPEVGAFAGGAPPTLFRTAPGCGPGLVIADMISSPAQG